MAETLVYSGLLCVVLTMVNYLAVGSVRYMHQADTGAILQQQAMTVVGQLTAELMESDLQTVSASGSAYSGTPYLIFAVPRAMQGNDLITGPLRYSSAQLEWQTWVCYYYLGSSSAGGGCASLLRQLATVSGAPASPPTSVPSLSSFTALSGQTRRLVTSNLLPMHDPQSGAANNGLNGDNSPGLWLSLDQTTCTATLALTFYSQDTGKANTLQLKTQVLLRN